jgi:hypothetical protein
MQTTARPRSTASFPPHLPSHSRPTGVLVTREVVCTPSTTSTQVRHDSSATSTRKAVTSPGNMSQVVCGGRCTNGDDGAGCGQTESFGMVFGRV